MIETKFDREDVLEDSVTGFKGTVTGIVVYTTGSNSYCLEADASGDKRSDNVWVDEERLIKVD